MTARSVQPLMKRLADRRSALTPKGRLLADFVTENPRQAVFMTTRQLAQAVGVSEATVVRFVDRLGYGGYSQFIQDLRELVDSELTLIDRMALTNGNAPGGGRLYRVVQEEMANLKAFFEHIDPETIGEAADLLLESPEIYVIGSRLSYTFAYYMGWSLTKVRGQVRILQGSDSTAIDWLTIAPKDVLVILFATTRYPNELIRLAKLVRRLDLRLIVVSDSRGCPVNQFAHLSIVARYLHFPLVGSPSTMACLINCLISEMAARKRTAIRDHQEGLEQAYLENDILFNMEGRTLPENT